MKRKLTQRVIAAVLAFVIFFEPIAIQVAKAQELPEPTVIDEEVGLMDPDDIMAPHDYLDLMLNFRGHNQQEMEMRAWGEWQEMINSAYLVIDEGATDVFGLYDSLTIMKTVKDTTCSVGDVVESVCKFAHMGAAFLDKVHKTNRAHTALSCWSKMNNFTEKAVNFCKNNRAMNFLSFCCPPSCWHNVKDASKGMDQYWHWIQNKGGKDVNTELSNAQGVARTVGIGFAVIGTVLATWHYLENEDKSVGRWSYNRVKDLVSVGFAGAALIAMFCIPVVGQVVAIVAAIWGVICFIGDAIGELNKKWKNAYKNSFWYLYENDPEFKVFYDNRDLLTKNEKSASLLKVEESYGDFKADKAIDGDTVEARNSRIYVALEKNGVLASYYNKDGFRLPSYSLEEMMELWSAKASYMAWKPTEAEAKEEKTFWKKVGAVFNPMTYISWGADKIGSMDYEELIKDKKLEEVYFNLDFVLMKKYENYLTSNRLGNDFYRSIGLRIEQSAFNYIPLLGIETSEWNEALLKEAFLADAFIVGQKEMAALHNQIELAVEGLEETIDQADDLVKLIDKEQLPHVTSVREFLDEFAEAYADNPNKENKSLYKKAKKLLDLDWDSSKEKTPANILEVCRESIEKALMYEPLAISQKAAEMVLLAISVKQQLDIGALMNTYIDEKWAALYSFEKDFKNKDIKTYLKDGNFLDVKNDGFLDWLSELYSAYDESDKTLQLMEKDVNEYNKLAGISASDERKTFIFFKKSVATPNELVNKINKELKAWKKTIAAWKEIASDANVKVVLAENETFAKKVLNSYTLKLELEALDPDANLEDLDFAIVAPADSTMLEAAEVELVGE